ncbi:MAG: nitroreductase [Hellea sp.]|nr:nitroreductase [Hellea sp.]
MPLNTDKSVSVTDAIMTRITCRGFLDKPVPKVELEQIFETARRTPSGGNLQPWRVHIMTGKTLANFTEACMDNVKSAVMEGETFPAYPSPLWEPQRSWRYKLGEDMYSLLDISRDNKLGRLMWLANNARFFGAPVGIIVTGNIKLGMAQHMDIGIYLQTIMMLAREAGLHTAPQGWWRRHPQSIIKFLNVPDDEHVLVGMALGYGDPDAPVNNLWADRAELEELVHFYD